MHSRRDWFKSLACSSHTWPVRGCQDCWDKIIGILERMCEKEVERGQDFEKKWREYSEAEDKLLWEFVRKHLDS